MHFRLTFPDPEMRTDKTTYSFRSCAVCRNFKCWSLTGGENCCMKQRIPPRAGMDTSKVNSARRMSMSIRYRQNSPMAKRSRESGTSTCCVRYEELVDDMVFGTQCSWNITGSRVFPG